MMRRFSPGAEHLPCKRRQAKERRGPKSRPLQVVESWSRNLVFSIFRSML